MTFDEVYPVADPMGGMRNRDKDSPPERVFDGDSAIASAIFSLQTAKKSIGEVVLVTFEQEVPPQMRQFQRPMTGPIPLEAIRKLRERLERMQFKVTEWNLATEGAVDKKPEGEKDVPQVFVFLPPPSAPPPMMRQQQNQPTFEPKHAKRPARCSRAAAGRSSWPCGCRHHRACSVPHPRASTAGADPGERLGHQRGHRGPRDPR